MHGVRRQGCAHTVNETVSAARMTSLSPQRHAGFLLCCVLCSVSHSFTLSTRPSVVMRGDDGKQSSKRGKHTNTHKTVTQRSQAAAE
ncbi:hypothetical protein J6590_087368 [Homalodisca vitripennis]|nr:hypothetical protein J6590_087367 [Homalodisca vitripennis]KAG8324650.1 hypothetical protein J6590_087368 [Homalodisca vitripennis]